MARARRQLQRRSGARPNRAWTVAFSSSFITVPANSLTLISLFVPANIGIDLTILRTVGHLSIASDQTGASEEQVGAFGMIIVTNAAFAIGVTAMPDPVSDANDEGWFVYQGFSQQTALNTIGVGSIGYTINSKAKRIMSGNGKTMVLMITNAHATQGLLFSLQIRFLTQVRGT